MKLIYWYAECQDDSDAYSIRERTKKAAQTQLTARPDSKYGPLHKVSVEYTDGFDLMQWCMGEGRGCWETKEGS